jgi:hypothetical protein
MGKRLTDLDRLIRARETQNKGLLMKKKGLEEEQKIYAKALTAFIDHFWDGENWKSPVTEDDKRIVNEAMEMLGQKK